MNLISLSFPGPRELVFLLLMAVGIALVVLWIVNRRQKVQQGFPVELSESSGGTGVSRVVEDEQAPQARITDKDE